MTGIKSKPRWGTKKGRNLDQQHIKNPENKQILTSLLLFLPLLSPFLSDVGELVLIDLIN